LTSFPIQPNMNGFYADNNRLTSFPIQPNMYHFEASNNQLTSLPIQPNMEICIADTDICPETDYGSDGESDDENQSDD
jgi:hypothetical protein